MDFYILFVLPYLIVNWICITSVWGSFWTLLSKRKIIYNDFNLCPLIAQLMLEVDG